MVVPVVVSVAVVMVVSVAVVMVVIVAVVMVVIVAVVMAVAAGLRAPPADPVEHAHAQHGDAHGDDEDGRGEVQPRVEVVRDDELRERERHAPEGCRACR